MPSTLYIVSKSVLYTPYSVQKCLTFLYSVKKCLIDALSVLFEVACMGLAEQHLGMSLQDLEPHVPESEPSRAQRMVLEGLRS